MTPVVRVEGRALPLAGANIDTDRIIPARFLRTVSFEGLEQHVFEDDRAELKSRGQTHPFDDPRFDGASILIVNTNFGCGSSREHAPQALYRRGLRAVIGESFSEIFFGNAMMLGMPCVTAAEADVRLLQERVDTAPATVLAIDLLAGTCCAGAGSAGVQASVPISLPSHARDALLTGAWNATALLLDRYDEVERAAARLPYLSGF